MAIHGLREYLDHPYRRLLDLLHEKSGIVEKLGLSVDDIPDFSTVCARKQRLKTPIWRILLQLSAELHDLGDIQAIDASEVDRVAAIQHYAKRMNYTFEAVKTTAVIDCSTGAILDIHCSTRKSHDTQVGWQLLLRNGRKLDAVVADKA